MMTFWLIASAMIVVALLLVLPAVLGRRRRRDAALSREQLNLATYQDRLRELDEARATGTLDDPDYAQARAELERAMLTDLERSGAAAPEGPPRRVASPLVAVVIGVGVPLLAFGLYLQLGTPDALEGVPVARAAAVDRASVEKMVTQLEERLRADPSDAEGWVMLARTYAFLKRDEQARDAFAKAVELTPDDPIALTGYAETLVRLGDGRIGEKPRQLLARALDINPDLQPALWLSGMAAFQQGARAVALEHWRRLRALGGLSPQALEVVDAFIARAEGDGAEKVAAAGPPAGGATGGKGEAGGKPAADGAASVRVRVELDPALAEQVSPGDVVYVFARAASGPPMPLAVVRKTVADLPVTVTLDDSSAMVAQMRLSAFPEVVLGARVSRSGTPAASSGDLQGLSPPVQVAEAELVEVRISEVVP